jgi:L-aspartate oxidase
MTEKFDYLVIGSGIAGLTFALKVADTGTVAIVTKKRDTESSTNYAQGGIAAVFNPQDSFDRHIEDTLKTGSGLSHPQAVNTLVQEGPERVLEMFQIGVNFTAQAGSDGKVDFDLGREGGHSINRIVHAKDHTGQAVEKALVEACKKHTNIKFFENHYALELLTDDQKEECFGVMALSSPGREMVNFLSRITLLCTGGTGRIYLHTTNPTIATGDGIAMAYRAGVLLGNLEFMQFHPTALYHHEADSFLISEAVRGYGGILRNYSGERFMERYHPDKELAPRDAVARAIDSEMKKRGEPCVFLDVTHLDAYALRRNFPFIYENCLKYKIDITRDPIPVVPAAHYICGGVVTDLLGRSSMKRLFATGEVAMTGVHGANRLASNSLLEALVFSHRAAIHARNHLSYWKTPDYSPPGFQGNVGYDEDEILITHDLIEIQRLMWDYVGIVRSNIRLQRAYERVKLIASDVENFYRNEPLTESLVELRNVATVAELVIRCALFRKESRGLHYNVDYPQTDDHNWKCDTIISRQGLESSNKGIVDEGEDIIASI